jgi:hypothetical protein
LKGKGRTKIKRASTPQYFGVPASDSQTVDYNKKAPANIIGALVKQKRIRLSI